MGDHALHAYFATDDGSLPEVVVDFPDPGTVVAGFELLSPHGGAKAAGVLARETESLHVVLGDIVVGGHALPDIGIYVDAEGLVLDYRMGSEWTDACIDAFLRLLAALERLGGVVSVPWWEGIGEADFKAAMKAL